MRIVIDINHPAHVHFFKNFIWAMRKKGHQILITASKKDIAIDLLDRYNFDYINLRGYGQNLAQKILNIPLLDFKMYQAVKSFKPDIFMGIGSFRAAHVAKILRKTCFVFEDSEPSPIGQMLYYYFTDVVFTPFSFRKNLGDKQIRYDGYHELAYLHPNYFKPNPKILQQIGLKKNDKFFILRFVAWRAGHDMGRKGINDRSKIKLVYLLNQYGKVMITAEKGLPKKLVKYAIKIPPEKIHDALYYATMFIGDSQTMATEAAILGTPAVRCNSFVGKNDMGNFLELEHRYDLIYSYNNFNQALVKIKSLLKDKSVKAKWTVKRKRLMADKVDVTAFMIDFVEKKK